MKVITHTDIMNLEISPGQCYEWAEYVIKNKDRMQLPPKISLKPGLEGVFYNTMPSILKSENIAGVKVVNRYPQRIPSLDSQILLYDLESGNLKCIMDGNFITTMRTGAVAAHSVKLFAVDNFSSIGIIGCGNTMRAAMKVLLELYSDRHFLIKIKKYKDQHEDFIHRFEGKGNLEFVVVETYEDVVRDSDVILSAVTYVDEDLCSDDCFKKGCCVVPIHTRGFTNCDLFFDKVYADDRGHVEGFKFFSRFRKFAEVNDVICGRTSGRENDEERILAYNIGISLQDIYFAEQIYLEVCKNKVCPEISLEGPAEKFWI